MMNSQPSRGIIPAMSAHPPAALLAASVLTATLLVAACSPTVKIEAPDKPIEINLNIKIEQEVRVRVERDAEELIETKPDIY